MTKKMTKTPLKSEGLRISFKKFLLSYYHNISHSTSETSQVILEYFILFTIIAALTIIGLSTFFPKIQQSFSAMQVSAVDRIVNAGN